MRSNDVVEAFHFLIEEIDRLLNAKHDGISKAIEKGEYDKAKALTEKCSQINDFKERVVNLKRDWKRFESGKVKPGTISGRRRLKKGVKTPQPAYRDAILVSLLELGTSAKAKEVLELVCEKMKDQLTPFDLEAIESNPKEPRWRNTAMWCRNDLANEGLISRDTPKGIWALTDKGRAEAEKIRAIR